MHPVPAARDILVSLTAGAGRKIFYRIQDLTPSFFPDVMDTSGIFGHTAEEVFGAKIPIGAMIGDQQSAAYAQGCFLPGEAKISFGTSGTCNVNTGEEIKLATGSYPLVLWCRNPQKAFCLEGMVITAGAVFNWLSEIGMINSTADAQHIIRNINSANGVRFLPALQGLGAPHNQFRPNRCHPRADPGRIKGPYCPGRP